MSDCEELIANGQIDEAIEIYKTQQPCTSLILKTIGKLYSDEKADYHLAVYYFQQALDLEEKNHEDSSDTLSELGLAHQNLHEYDLALICNIQALTIRQQKQENNPSTIVSNLFGIANAYWGLQNLPEAFSYAQQALTINESIESGNEINIATNLAILSNIYHRCGDDIRALEFAQRALTLFESCLSVDSTALIALLNNIATIQISLNMFNDALLTFIRALRICEKSFPQGHPKRSISENMIQRVRDMQEYDLYSYSHLGTLLTKFLLF